jgi:ABC-type sugar transport system substrate-binding protein
MAVLECNISACSSLANGIIAASKSIGWQTKAFVDQLTAQTIATNVQAAISWGANVLASTTLDMTPTELADLHAHHIKVIGGGNTPTLPYNIITRNAAYMKYVGNLQAAVAVTESKTPNPDVGFVLESGSNATANQGIGLKEGLKAFCPKCTTQTLPISTTVTGNIAGQIVNWLRANPKINFVDMVNETDENGLHPALQSAGLQNIPLEVNFASSLSLPLLQNGQLLEALTGSDNAFGYLITDAAIRLELGMSTKQDLLPNAVPPSVIIGPHVTEVSQGAPGYAAYFHKLWGVK